MTKREHRTRSRTLLVAAAAGTVVLGSALPANAGSGASEPAADRMIRLIPRRPPRSLSTPTIDFSEFYVFGDRAPQPTPKLLGLHGQRVTVVGFMVLLQQPVRGGFYLSAYPALADESGAGRGDLPPTSLLVLPSVAADREVAFVPGALEITGVLDVGNRESNGEAASIRLLVDDVARLKFARTRRTYKAARTHTERGRVDK